MVATAGSKLISDEAISTLKEVLIPLADVITPNIPEMEVLSGMTIRSDRDMERAAAKFAGDTCHCAVLCKGGHQLNDANDLLYADGENLWFYGKRIATSNTHGTGCTLSSAIASNLAKGRGLAGICAQGEGVFIRCTRRYAGFGEGKRPHEPCICHRGRVWR